MKEKHEKILMKPLTGHCNTEHKPFPASGS